MKKLIVIAVIIFTLLGGLNAISENEQILIMEYDFRNDIPTHLLSENMTDEDLKRLANGDLFVNSLVPLPGGCLLLCGQYLYVTQRSEESFDYEYEHLPQRSDAYAIAVDKGGSRLWSLRFGDPQSENNSFQNAWLMEDGRILLQYSNNNGTLGTMYFIINQDGKIDEMLSPKTLRNAGIENSLSYVSEGFIGGGYQFNMGAISSMEPDDAIVMFDLALNEKWRISSETLSYHRLYAPVREMEDGYLLSGEVSLAGGASFRPSVVKISKNGIIEWQYSGNEEARTYVVDAWPMEDGGCFIITGTNPQIPTPANHPNNEATLTRLNQSGVYTWSKNYKDEFNVDLITCIYALDDGILLGCILEGTPITYALLHVDNQGELLGFYELPLLSGSKAEYATMHMVDGPDGAVYVFGNEIYSSNENGFDSYRTEKLYYILITKEL